jgi:hypothetical protein
VLRNSVRSKRNKILAYISIVGIASLLAYPLYPNNPLIVASVLAVSPLLLCPVTCGILGLVIWFATKLSKYANFFDCYAKYENKMLRMWMLSCGL